MAKELEDLQRYFIYVLEFLEERVEASGKAWETTTVITKSLGYHVPVYWMAQKLKGRGKLQYDAEAFPLVEDHCIF